MPIIKSAIKKARQDEKRREGNLKVKIDLKAKIKKIRKEIIAKKLDEAKKEITEVISALDKAAKINVIHKNKAARLKSRLIKKLNLALGKPVELAPSKPAVPKTTTKPKISKKSPKKSSKEDIRNQKEN